MLAFAYRPVKLQIEKKFGGTADLRLAQNKAVSMYPWSNVSGGGGGGGGGGEYQSHEQ